MSISAETSAPELSAPDQHPWSEGSAPDHLRRQRLLHDLRQSVSAVMSLAAVVEKSLDRGPEVLKRLDQIRSEADWMTRLVSSAGPRARDLQTLDVGDVVTEAWASAAAVSGCAIRLVRDPGACASLDRDDLCRSVRNLLDNALRAAGEGGAVEVEVRVEPLTVAVVVRDSGPGFGNIPAQQGLGLLTVRRFAGENGGRLDVGRATLGGAEVTLRLPRTPSACTTSSGDLRCGS